MLLQEYNVALVSVFFKFKIFSITGLQAVKGMLSQNVAHNMSGHTAGKRKNAMTFKSQRLQHSLVSLKVVVMVYLILT
jgi:hypothetical protein